MSMICQQPKIHNPIGLLGMGAGLVGATASTLLLKCDAPCHPANPNAWRYIGTLLRDDDAIPFGYKGFSAPDLFIQENRAYLLISPTSNTPVNGAYNGCFVIPVTDLAHGTLARDAAGKVNVIRRIEGSPNSFNGACTYQPYVTGSGFMYGEIAFGDKPFFQIFQTAAAR